MADLQILREHALGLRAIRKIAFTWAEQVETDYGMCCVYQEGRTEDALTFTAPGVRGSLWATRSRLEIQVDFGVWMRPFQSRVESEILKNLDTLIQQPRLRSPTSRHAKR